MGRGHSDVASQVADGEAGLLCGSAGQKGALSREDGDGGSGRAQAPHHQSNARRDLSHLGPCDVLRDRCDVAIAEHVKIGANHSRQASARFRPAPAPSIRRFARVFALGDLPEPEMDVGGHGKELGGDATLAALVALATRS